MKAYCEKCGNKLGRYSVGWGEDADADIAPTRLPRGMVEWDGRGAPPRLYFYRELGRMDRGMAIPRPDVKYRWRCSCGANPTWRRETLGSRILKYGEDVPL